YLLCGDTDRAEDIVAATTMVVYRQWHRVREVDNVDAYVHRILVRKFISERRLRGARGVLTDRLPEAARAGRATGTRVAERGTPRAALAKLSTAQRTVLVLRFACDQSVEEVARILRCSTGNVKSHTSRGLAAMRTALADDPTVDRTTAGQRRSG